MTLAVGARLDPPDVEQARRLVRAHVRAEIEPSDRELDLALGLDPALFQEASAEEEVAGALHRDHSVVHVATPYACLRGFFDEVRPRVDDRVVDLGCGIGRVLLYAALATPALVRGIELLPSRAAVARTAASRLGLPKVSVETGSVLDHDWSDATVLFMFRPFSDDVEREVLRRVHDLGRARRLVVGAYRMRPGLFDAEIFEGDARGDLRVLRSRAAP